MKKQLPGIRLQLLVSGSIVIGMLVLAASIIFHSYQSNRRILIELAQENAQQIAAKIDSQIERHTQPIITALKLLSQDSIITANDHSSRMKRIKLLKLILDENPVVSSAYLGYSNGDFFLLRKLNSDLRKKAVSAPDDASYMVQSLERNTSGQVLNSVWLFFDKGFNLLSRRNTPEYQFDPRSRRWFASAVATDKLYLGEPYVFYTTQQVGVTLSMKAAPFNTVVGMDASIDDLSELMQSLLPNEFSRLALVNDKNVVLGFPDSSKLVHLTDSGAFRLSRIKELEIPLFNQLVEQKTQHSLVPFATGQGIWFGQSIHVGPTGKENWSLLYGIPESALLQSATTVLHQQLIWSGVIIGILLLVGWFFGRLVALPMLRLSSVIEGMRAFDFRQENSVSSYVREVNILSQSLSEMSAAIQSFRSISLLLSQEQDMDKMLNGVVTHLLNITDSKAACIYLFNSKQQSLDRATQSQWGPSSIPCPQASREDFVEIVQKTFSADDEQDTTLSIPLCDRRMSVIGVLILLHDKDRNFENPAFVEFVSQISGSAATAIETRKHVESQTELIDAIIRLLADAIDAKSPYTSGHCERVPILAEMLIDEAQKSHSGSFAGFMMDDTQRREFKIAAWLHDCGKITSQEYIIDKATKLETIHNRIHEIRTRFEVLWRDRELDYWQKLYAGENQQELQARLDRELEALQEDFTHIANLNIGAESMSSQDLEKLNHISRRVWTRHFSSRQGLSRDEWLRVKDLEESLPCTELLLDDKVEHIIPWGENRPPVGKHDKDNIWGFDMTLPQHELNKGEIYNLSIERGTLTEEERFLVNNHIVQTIKMLSKLPFPDEMQRVPDIAGNHHEKIDGRGYPRKLSGEELSIPEKVMALADIFEALTAADRPYKEAKTLSESLAILADMVKQRHIDEDTFRLFIESKTYLRYAEKFLSEKQKDNVNEKQILQLAELV
ncbi:GAF domain-containing protein [Vibrio sp.]|nr:GAF domain-containing protein [Vibrio sp.]